MDFTARGKKQRVSAFAWLLMFQGDEAQTNKQTVLSRAAGVCRARARERTPRNPLRARTRRNADGQEFDVVRPPARPTSLPADAKRGAFHCPGSAEVGDDLLGVQDKVVPSGAAAPSQ